MAAEYYTHEDTANGLEDGEAPTANHAGLFRDPMPMSDGTLWAVHSASPYMDDALFADPGYPAPLVLSSRYNFAIRELVPGPNGSFVPGGRLNPEPIVETVSYWDNYRYRQTEYSGAMWELQPVEVVARPRPPMPSDAIPSVEAAVLNAELGGAVGVQALRDYLEANELALVISRDVTVRADEQQDINLRIAWSGHETAEAGSTPKEIGWMQFFEGQQLRGYRWEGRRVIARPISDALNPAYTGAPEGAVRLGDDGSMAAFVPARRAVSWQTTEPSGAAAVRERYWLTFQPGEIRVCANCHGVNQTDVFGNAEPANEPQALRDLLQWWQTN